MDMKMFLTRVSRFLLGGSILRPRQLVEIRGAGRHFEGLYFVEKVTHGISEEGYKVTFITIRPTKDTLVVNDDNDGDL